MHSQLSKINTQTMYQYFTFHWFSVRNKLTEQESNTVNNCGRKSKHKISLLQDRDRQNILKVVHRS